MTLYSKKHRKVVIFSEDRVTSNTLYNAVRRFLLIGEDKPSANQNNYLEVSFSTGKNEYTLASTSSVLFPCRDDNEISREEKVLNQRLLLSSDLIYLSVNIDKVNLEYNLSLQKYLNQNKKKHLVVFSSNEISKDEFEDGFLTSLPAQRMIKNSEGSYFFSFLANDRTLSQLSQFIHDEFPFNNDSGGIEHLSNRETVPKLTIFGPPNSGKSTLLNSLLNKERSVVSPLAGTTRGDAVSLFEWKETFFEVRDTEGVVTKKRNDYSLLSSCQIAWVVLDSRESVTKKTLQIISLAEKCNRAVIIILNKIDIASSQQIEERRKEINLRLKSFAFVPIIPISAQKKSNLSYLLAILQHSVKQSHLTFSRALLAQQFSKLLEKNPPATVRGRHLKIYYALHEKGFVHKFIIFVNNPGLIHFSYQRYIVNYLRRNLGIDSLPLRVFFKKS